MGKGRMGRLDGHFSQGRGGLGWRIISKGERRDGWMRWLLSKNFRREYGEEHP